MLIKTRMKVLLAVLVSGLMYLSFASVARADDLAVYDLSSHESQSFQLNDAQGNPEEITVVPDTTTAPLGINLLVTSRAASHGYTISKHGAGWSVSFHITVVNGRLTSANSLKASAYIGSLRDSDLSRLTDHQARWTALYILPVVSTNVSCTATLSHGQIQIS